MVVSTDDVHQQILVEYVDDVPRRILVEHIDNTLRRTYKIYHTEELIMLGNFMATTASLRWSKKLDKMEERKQAKKRLKYSSYPKHNFWVHLLLFMVTAGLGNIVYAIVVSKRRSKWVLENFEK